MEKLPYRYEWLRYWKSLLWALIIAIGLFTPGEKLPQPHLFYIDNLDKVFHAGIFLLLEWLVLYDSVLPGAVIKPEIIRRTILTAFVVSYAIFTELMQLYVFLKRDGDIVDLLFDIAGIIIALLSFNAVFKLTNRFSLLKK
jgi:VanZ family protein